MYLLPYKIIVDRGKELLAKFKAMMANDYRIQCNSINTSHLKANVILVRTHQTIGNIICIFKIQQMDLDNENPWEGILSSTLIYYVCHTVHGAHFYTAYIVATGIW